MKNQDIINCYEGLQTLREATGRRLPARTSFIIVRNLRTLQPIVEDIQQTYNTLVAKYAEPVGNDKYKIKEDCLSAFNEELQALYNLETDVPIVKIKFSDIENLDFSIKETDALYFMIKDENEEI